MENHREVPQTSGIIILPTLCFYPYSATQNSNTYIPVSGPKPFFVNALFSRIHDPLVELQFVQYGWN